MAVKGDRGLNIVSPQMHMLTFFVRPSALTWGRPCEDTARPSTSQEDGPYQEQHWPALWALQLPELRGT